METKELAQPLSGAEDDDDDPSKLHLSNAMLNTYRAFVVCSVILVYIGSVFMTYVILADVIFQVVRLFVTLTVMFEKGQNNNFNKLKFVQQICWVLYSFSIISMIVLIIKKQFVSFFSTMWDSLGTEQVLAKISGILSNPNVNKKLVYASLISFAVYFLAMIASILIQMFRGLIDYSAFFIALFFVPIVWGILKVIWEAWRIAYHILKGDYSKYTFEPSEQAPNFPFPTDLIDPAKLREQNEFLNFIMDDRTNVYLQDGNRGKKILGYLHIVALFIGLGIRIYFMIQSSDPVEWTGLIMCAFYLYSAPLLVFCNFFSTFLPEEAFKDEDMSGMDSSVTGNKNFDKGDLHLMFYIVNAIYVVIFIFLIFLSILMLTWVRPEEKYAFPFFTNSSLMSAYWDLATSSATTCNVDVKGMTFTQLSALPMLTYFTDDSKNVEIVEHNRKVITSMALSSFKEGKVTMPDYTCLDDGIHIRDRKLHIFVINGLRRAVDWVLLFEQFLQQYYFLILTNLIPFYGIVYGKFRVALILTNKYFSIMTGCEFLTLNKAAQIKKQITTQCIPKKSKWHTYTNIAVGHLTGGYYSKYLATFALPTNPKMAGIGFDSLSFQGTALEVENTKNLDFGMTLNVFAKGSFYGGSEEKTKNNFERNAYDGFTPPDAVHSFCHSVAMCSNNRFEIDFCNSILPTEWEEIMKGYGRKKTPDSSINNVGVVTNKDDGKD